MSLDFYSDLNIMPNIIKYKNIDYKRIKGEFFKYKYETENKLAILHLLWAFKEDVLYHRGMCTKYDKISKSIPDWEIPQFISLYDFDDFKTLVTHDIISVL